MLRNYLKVAFRNLKRQKSYALINVTGLAVGVAATLLLLLFVRNELTFDRFHEESDRIFRIIVERTQPVNVSIDMTRTEATPFPLGPLLEDALPEVERFVRLENENATVLIGDDPYQEELLFADSTFFDVFSFPLRSGNARTVLRQPNVAVLSAEAAEKYFEDANPVGKTFSVRSSDTTRVVTIGGVAAPFPPNSSLTFRILLPLSESEENPSWRGSSPQTFVELAERKQKDQVEAKLPALIQEHIPEVGRPSGLNLQPLTALHFSTVPRDRIPTSRPVYASVLGGIAGFILLIACINFTTLAVGRSASRAREVGMRKTLGARRTQLIGQFWGEAALVVFASTVAGVILARLFLPAFNSLVGQDLTLFASHPLSTLTLLVGIVLLVSLLTGSYPAFFLSRFEPAKVFKGELGVGGKNRLMRGLVALQFGLSIFLVTGTLFMNQQLDLFLTKDLGFDEEQVVWLRTAFDGETQLFRRLKTELADEPQVVSVAGSFNTIAGEDVIAFQNNWPVESGSLTVRVRPFRVTSGMVNTLGLELKTGSTFEDVENPEGVIVNEALVRAFGWKRPTEHFIGGDKPVIGVVKDFNYRSLHHAVEPMLIRLLGGYPIVGAYVRLAPNSLPGALDMMRSTWQDIAPDVPFRYHFLDEAINESYRDVRQWTAIIGYGSLFAIAVACLGVFGLATLSTERRRKEIGIRKVLGASAANVVVLLSKDFARLVAVGFLIAVPFAYYAAQRWIQEFAYRIEIGPWTFLAAGLLAGTVAMTAVGYQAMQAALENPVDTIRYE